MSETPAQPHIAADEDEGVEDQYEGSTTTSIRTSILASKQEHGREYHAYKDGAYHRPNDEAELNRLDIANNLLTMVNDDKLYLAPIGESPSRILDIGAGTGQWCIEMGDMFPDAEVIGIDISASQPSQIPPNVKFEIDDAEDPWTFGQPFDFIHSRYMVGAIKDWPGLMKQSYENLKPGGWIEFQDLDIDHYSQDGSLTEEHAFRRWMHLCREAAGKMGRTLRPGKELEHWVKEAGFSDVHVRKTSLPIGMWPKDARMKKMGTYNWVTTMEGLEAVSLRLFMGVLQWTKEDLDKLLDEVRGDLKNPKIHPMYDMYSVWAKRPEA